MDALSRFLSLVRVHGSLFSRAEMRAPWGVETRGAQAGIFHVVVRGAGFIEVEGQTPRAFRAGDVLVMPHGHAHVLRDAPNTASKHIADWPSERGGDGLPCVLAGAEGALTSVLCGTLRLDDEARELLLPLLPPLIHVPGGEAPTAGWLDATLRGMAAELDAGRPGGAALVARLADLLFVHVLRAWIEQAPDGARGWLSALKDPRLARGLSCIHGDPARSWTVQDLARQAGMSRSAFFSAFSEQVGETPAAYLLRWRMSRARAQLRRGSEGLAVVASSVGYGSEAAFSRAFKRHVGVSPSTWRHQQRAAG